ncbi:MAG: CBS domain-containing protein, partial [Candidatus Hecatellaceae archaeon]
KVIDVMLEKGVWSVLVEKQGLPVGVITDRDIFRRCLSKKFSPEACKAEEIMSSPLITISPDESIMEAMKTMTVKNIRRLFIVEEGKVVGRVTQAGLFSYILGVLMTFHDLGITI